MKRIYIILCIMALLLIQGCSSKVYATAKGISIAKQAIEVADNYLDGETDYSTANEKLIALRDNMEYYTELPQETAEEKKQYACDSSIATYITVLNHNILMDSNGGDNETYNSIIEIRNSIAEMANLEQR